MLRSFLLAIVFGCLAFPALGATQEDAETAITNAEMDRTFCDSAISDGWMELQNQQTHYTNVNNYYNNVYVPANGANATIQNHIANAAGLFIDANDRYELALDYKDLGDTALGFAWANWEVQDWNNAESCAQLASAKYFDAMIEINHTLNGCLELLNQANTQLNSAAGIMGMM